MLTLQHIDKTSYINEGDMLDLYLGHSFELRSYYN